MDIDPCEQALKKYVARIPSSRANALYSDEEVELILTQLPTWENIVRLSRVLGRTKAAIAVVFEMAYSSKWLKAQIEKNEGCAGGNVHMRIAAAKKKLGIIIGHRP